MSGGEINLDSSSDEGGGEKTDADELYDPDIDDTDERWAERQRGGRSSDAVLSCPACFTSLCLECQQHSTYPTQFRAMFVRNCRVVRDQILRIPPAAKGGGMASLGKRRRKAGRRRQNESSTVQREANEAQEGATMDVCKTGLGRHPIEEGGGDDLREHSLAGLAQGAGGEVFYPVKCSECSTDVAVLDSDEVYHFFYVIPSYS